jgi:hypothetical protein
MRALQRSAIKCHREEMGLEANRRSRRTDCRTSHSDTTHLREARFFPRRHPMPDSRRREPRPAWRSTATALRHTLAWHRTDQRQTGGRCLRDVRVRSRKKLLNRLRQLLTQARLDDVDDKLDQYRISEEGLDVLPGPPHQVVSGFPSTGYLSYRFTMPKELSLVAEGHPAEARKAIYAALPAALDTAFPGKEYKAVAAVYARNEVREVHYHAHVLVGKFAKDTARSRVFSLNSAGGGNSGRRGWALSRRPGRRGWTRN